MRIDLASELSVLADALVRIAQRDRRSHDFTTIGLRRALTEVIAALPVYRTYVVDDEIEPEDRSVIDVGVARRRARAASRPTTAVFDFIRDVLSARAAADARIALRSRRRAALRDALSAIHRSGHGEVDRRHRLLPLRAAGGAQRGRRRTGALRPLDGGIPRRQRRTRAARIRTRCSPPRRTITSAARTRGCASPRSPSSRPNGAAPSHAGRA